MKLFNKATDERQEIELKNIASKCFYVISALLICSIIVQLIFSDSIKVWHVMASEVLCVWVGCIFFVVGCLKKGIWGHTKFKPTIKSYLLTGTITALVFTLIFLLIEYFTLTLDKFLSVTILNSLFVFLGLFVGGFLLAAIVGRLVKRRQLQLERKFSDK